jgi:hypothetical protein
MTPGRILVWTLLGFGALAGLLAAALLLFGVVPL